MGLFDSNNGSQQSSGGKQDKHPFTQGLESFMKQIGSGLATRFVDALSGPEAKKERLMTKESQLEEGRQQTEDLVKDNSALAATGQFTPDMGKEALKQGISPALVDSWNTQTQQYNQRRQQGTQDFVKAYQSGAFGDPKDPDVQKMAGIAAFTLAHSNNPEVVAAMQNFMSLYTKGAEARLAAQVKFNEKLNETTQIEPIKQSLIEGRQARQEGRRMADEESLVGQRLSASEQLAKFKSGLPKPGQEATEIGKANQAIEAAGGAANMRQQIPNIGMSFTLPGGAKIEGRNMAEVMQSAVNNGVIDSGHAQRFNQLLNHFAVDPHQDNVSMGRIIVSLVKDFPEPFRSMILGNISNAMSGGTQSAAKEEKASAAVAGKPMSKYAPMVAGEIGSASSDSDDDDDQNN